MMEWPLNKNPANPTNLIWSESFAPIALANQFKSLEELKTKLMDYSPPFLYRESDYNYNRPETSIQYKFWLGLVGILFPLIWLAIVSRVVYLFSDDNSKIQGLELTLTFILIIGITFGSLSGYVLYRRFQDRRDVIDQLNLLHYHLKNRENRDEALETIIEERNGKLYWKRYNLNWNLSDVFPKITIIDTVGIYGSLISIVYIFFWLINMLRLVLTSFIMGNPRFFLVFVEIILILTFILLIWIGVRYGLSHKFYMNWQGTRSNRFIRNHTIIIAISMISLLVLDLVRGSLTLVFLVPILFSAIPVISAFASNRLRFLYNYHWIRLSLIKNIEANRIRTHFETEPHFDYLILSDASQRLLTKSVLPTSKITPVVLVVSAFISVIVPIITAFLSISSVDRLLEFIKIIFT